MTDLTGKTAIVTGSARGIGKAIALRYASLGANVVVNYVSDPAVAEATVADVKKFGVEAIAIRADVSALTDIERIFSEALARFSSSLSSAPESKRSVSLSSTSPKPSSTSFMQSTPRAPSSLCKQPRATSSMAAVLSISAPPPASFP